MNLPASDALPGAEAGEQFKLVRLQTFNWGTFSGVFDFPISPRGYLFVGPSGSGKSTILDANAALMTPPKWVDFNVAAREAERTGRDRSLMTYLRGAWAQQTGDGGEYVSQYLRTDTTWSAIAQTFRDGSGRVVVLAQALWIRGKSTAASDVRRQYLVLEREFDVRELKFLPAHDFDVRRFKFDLPDAFTRDEFSGYQERFRRLLDIGSERALRLLHKTQSAKNLGDLNAFLRDFMLDAPETFALADRLVEQFRELKDAHRAVVDARRQIETLRPAREEKLQWDESVRAQSLIDELGAAVDAYQEQSHERLLDRAVAAITVELDGLNHELQRLKDLETNEQNKWRTLQDRRSDMGGSLLERLAGDLADAERLRGSRLEKREQFQRECRALDWPLPDSAMAFAERRDAAQQYLLQEREHSEHRDDRRFALRRDYEAAAGRFEVVRDEIAALERQRSNIPARMLNLRDIIARAIHVAEERLPFAGELMQVKAADAAWQGAIERVLGGFAQSLLVDEGHYAKVSAYLNANHINERLVYYRVAASAAALTRSVSADSLIHKLEFAVAEHSAWLRDELKSHFDYACVDSVAALRKAERAITREGQVRHGRARHEKNDRFRIDDRSRWVLGFDNSAKLALYREQAAAQAQEIERLRGALAAADGEREAARSHLLACNQIVNTRWEEIDVAAALARIDALKMQIRDERAAHPDLEKLDYDIERQHRVYELATKRSNECSVSIALRHGQLAAWMDKREHLSSAYLSLTLTPAQRNGLDARFAALPGEITLERLDSATLQVVRTLGEDRRAVTAQIVALRASIERRLQAFVTNWPAEAGGLDGNIASAEDFFAKLDRLEHDGLPAFEARFLQLLREQSDQNLTRLSTQLDHERKGIRDRMGVVNESLSTAPFGLGTHLHIETKDKQLDDVIVFKQSLRASLSQSLSDDAELAEKRFEVISALVNRFSSQDAEDRRWRALVLDVRQHVEFVAIERDADGTEVEVYVSGAGKSGGQRQKLAATCLAAALRYQLGGQERALPRFSTVFLDEAFDKADAEFTTMAMNIFKTFGFQMIVATPLKSVMTLEPFIGGACFVHIKERKASYIVPIEFDEASNRLRLSALPDSGHDLVAS